MKRFLTLVFAVALVALAMPVAAAPSQFPDVVALPDGIAPEGIVSGGGTDFYVGSLADGTIYKGDYRTGAGGFINDPGDFDSPRVAVGLDFDSRSGAVWVAGGGTGDGYVYDGDSGETLAVIPLTPATVTFVNDVVVTPDTAYFTQSFEPEIYAVELDRRGMPTGAVETIQLSGDFTFIPNTFNANGIVATPNGKTLMVDNGAVGELYIVDQTTGAATKIDLGTADVAMADGMLLDGKTLYVVQNFANQISVVELSPDFATGAVGDVITDADFMIPTTVAEFGNSLYAVNARFDVPSGPDIEYQVVQVGK